MITLTRYILLAFTLAIGLVTPASAQEFTRISFPFGVKQGNTVTSYGSGAPTGSCKPHYQYIDSDTGNFYVCKVATWTITGSPAGSDFSGFTDGSVIFSESAGPAQDHARFNFDETTHHLALLNDAANSAVTTGTFTRTWTTNSGTSLSSAATFTAAANSAGVGTAGLFTTTLAGTKDYSGTSIGVEGILALTTTGAVADGTVFKGTLDNSAATGTTASAFTSRAVFSGAAAQTNFYGFHALTPANVGGDHLTNGYGMYVDDQSGGATKNVALSVGVGGIEDREKTAGSILFVDADKKYAEDLALSWNVVDHNLLVHDDYTGFDTKPFIEASGSITNNGSIFPSVTGFNANFGTLLTSRVTNLVGFSSSPFTDVGSVVDGAVIGFQASLYIDPMSTTPDAYGVKVEDVTGAATNYAIKTGLGLNDFGGTVKAPTYATTTNCSDSAGDAACSAAPAGSVVMDATDTTTVVATTAVTANSQIFIQEDSSLGTRLGVTCNTTIARTYAVTARTAATSFTITASAAPAVNPACLSYHIIN